MPSNDPTSLTSPDRVQAVIGNPDPVRRNLQITQSYHELTVAFEDFFGPADRVWCAYATWASKQAGRFIRNEEVPRRLRRFLGLEDAWWQRWLSPAGWLRSSVFLAYVHCTVEDVSAHVGEGNRIVYEKLAPLYADLLASLRADRRPDAAAIERFLERVGHDPTTGETLVQAFRAYFAAAAEDDPGVSAQLVFLGNALVGWHEQLRLQEAVDGALRAPIRRALDDPDRLFTRLPLPFWVRGWIAVVFRWLMAVAIRRFEKEWLEISTECMMTLATPTGVLRLGDDIPPLADGEMFPAALRHPDLPELVEVLTKLDLTPDTLGGSGARDWTDVGDRMNYIVDYFRSRQQDRELLTPPYLPDQVSVIHGGGFPAGAL